jgi:hypothetical protein
MKSPTNAFLRTDPQPQAMENCHQFGREHRKEEDKKEEKENQV